MTAPHLVASCAETRALDQALERELGLDSAALMEIAGFGCFLLMRDLIAASRRMVVASGSGQNGGDGFVVARYALAAGCDVSVFAMKAPTAGTAAAVHLRRLEPFGARVSVGELDALERALADREGIVVDALFGTGLTLPLREEAARWIASVDRAKGKVVSIDLPSGLDGDTGEAPSGCVHPAVTLTIGAVKQGLLAPAGAGRAGKVELVPLPYPPRLTAHLRRSGC